MLALGQTHEALDHVRMVLDGADEGEMLSAGRNEVLVAADTDFFEGLEAVREEPGGDDCNPPDAASCEAL